ncbi:MAG: hypothetical protein KDN05_02400, partial [Verrucomicrobiae bacterium]|nr:hypothetical protein [Verrucomicrobiae bacterium]
MPLLTVATVLASFSTLDAAPDFVPLPAKVELAEGRFTLSKKTVIVAPAALTNEAELLAERLRRVAGLPSPIQETGKGIVLKIDERMAAEGYGLKIDANGVTIHAGSNAGVFYGI